MDSKSPTPFTLPVDHLGLYVHIPFCVRKCRYCDFASQPLSANPSLPERYLAALACEAELRREEIDRPLQSIFIGGGTPTLLSGKQLRRLWRETLAPFPRKPDAEITLEANPGTLSDDVLQALAELPLTRVSLGMQSAHADELAMMGRIHVYQDVVDAVRALRGIGIPHINLDLIYALPGQTAARWTETLRCALDLAPDHLSLYALMLEEGTPLAAQVAAGSLPDPSEQEEEMMTGESQRMLAEAGFTRYEVSNAARPGGVCRHNLGYWLGRDYLGLGASAVSTVRGVRWRNLPDAASYTERLHAGRPVIAYAERLSAPARLLEHVMLGLRLRGGFDLAAAEIACGCRLRDMAPAAFAVAQRDGLLVDADGVLRLTDTGFPIANTIVAGLMEEADTTQE
jgi:oxygen-independent coproporphyrinogen-3 oxidase